MEIIIFKKLDGSCGVIYPAPNPLIKEEQFETIDSKKFLPTKATAARIKEAADAIIKEASAMVKENEVLVKAEYLEEEKKIKITKLVERVLTIEEIAKKDVPPGLPYRITTTDKIPQDRYFRAAWTDENPSETVDICMKKAKDIHMNFIRRARAKKFVEIGFPNKLNEELEKAVISQETRDKLQALRDIPINTDLSKATSPEELKNIWPEILN